MSQFPSFIPGQVPDPLLVSALAEVLGEPFCGSSVPGIWNQIEILRPSAGKIFWHSVDAAPGLYLVLVGKVRLIDRSNNLLQTLEAGKSFGEMTLFADLAGQPWAARASLNSQVGFVPEPVVRSLMRQYPELRDRLRQRAMEQVHMVQNRSEILPEPVAEPMTEPMTDLERSPCSRLAPTTLQPHSRKSVRKAYFPSPTLRVGHLWQRVTRRYPFFEQQSASDCGAACLVMVGRYWGKRFNLNRLRDIANVDRNGASLRGLAVAAESIGFTTRPVKASLDKLAQQTLPAIVHWEGKHYIVVYEVSRDRVIVGDPAIGQRSLSHRDFKAGWNGYTLLLQPTALY
ncbi:cysteine peptidase family C39 domain-containing protein [Leptothermofonsia sichuanensis]|uniref:cysteine peptidase family C39 domain-containing protein n=1 Tax=Leptothermofonsia sichuanensis TaxID=2917832 RepID=UPI001EEF92E1